MKRGWLVGISLLFVSLIPTSQAVVLFALPSPFSATYYAELSPLYQKLKNTEKSKIVVLGNSSVAFGLNSALLREELNRAGEDYEVCNFGLYGSLGTKAMMDLALNTLKSGDVVLLAPELYSQAVSLYFSGEEMWYSADCDHALFNDLPEADRQEMIGSIARFNSQKFSYLSKGTTADSGTVYARSSFDDNGDLTQVDRPCNKMTAGVDKNNPISLDFSLVGSDFLSYVNDYAASLEKKGVSTFYSFAPMNLKAVTDSSEATVSAFYHQLQSSLNFPVISSPSHYLMNAGYFYDSNWHLNSVGMTYRTLRLAEDLFNQWGISTPLSRDYPEPPDIPSGQETTGEGDDSDGDCFTYEKGEDGNTIVGLTEKGLTAESLVMPYSYQGGKITSFADSVFQDDARLLNLVLQSNLTTLADNSFRGCSKLAKITIEQEDPENLAVGYSFLNGVEDCLIYVPSESLSEYLNNYFWGHYAANLRGY